MRNVKVLGMVMAGGKGERLYPLTRERTKPSVPFGGKYRIIDFVLSNFINSGILSIYVLVQYRSQSLIEHLRISWQTRGLLRQNFITVVPPQMRTKDEIWYRGTADSISQNLNLIYDFNPDLVAVFGADHIYRMDISQMVDFHLKKNAEVTVAALPMRSVKTERFGVIQTDKNQRIINFKEKPSQPAGGIKGSKQTFISMGNYLFNKDLLIKILKLDIKRDSKHDFGRTILPAIIQKKCVFAYDFLNNRIPGTRPYEERGYWKDVGDIHSYWRANIDLLGTEPKFDLSNPGWPIYGAGFEGSFSRLINADIEDCIVSEGCIIKKASLRHSVLGRGVVIEDGARIENSIIMDSSLIGRNARLKRVIVDRFNEIEDNAVIGYDKKKDREKYYLDTSGIVVIPRGMRKNKI